MGGKPVIPVLESVSDLIELAGRLPPSTVIIPGGDRVEDLRLVESGRDHGFIDRVMLVGDRGLIEKGLAEVEIDIPAGDIIHAPGDEEAAAATVSALRAGGIDVVLKGNISTPVINRHMRPLAVRSTVSLATVFDAAPIAGGRPLLLTDAGFTTVCNFGRLSDLINNALDVARVVMGLKRPRVAVLSANEKQISSLPSTRLGLELASRSWPSAAVCGPLSFDLAVDPDSVAIKGMPDLPHAEEVAGRADILVCPGIDSANILYKTIAAMAKYGQASLAGITVGFPVPFIILSRSDTVDVRLDSIALCGIYAQRTRSRRPRRAPAAPAAKVYRILAVNPGSTSTKLSLFENDRAVRETEVPHKIRSADTAAERRLQGERLTAFVLQALREWDPPRLDAVVGRGGFLPRPPGKLSSGAYIVSELKDGKIEVDEGIVAAVIERPGKVHASNLGIPVAAELSRRLGAPAFMVDPVVVDEFCPEAEISGYAPIVRRSTAHVLSLRATARRAAAEIGLPLKEVNLVIAHLGGGITIAAMRRGRIVDNTIALLGGGPMTPQRAGQLPSDDLIELCYGGKFTKQELKEELTKRGGLQSYLGTFRMEEVEKAIAAGDAKARLAAEAMVYQIAKSIGEMFVAAGGDVEAIALTGGLARNDFVVSALRRRVGRLAPVLIFREALEMTAMAEGVIPVLEGSEKARRYPGLDR